MRSRILSSLVPLLWLSMASSQAADEPKPLTPTEKYRALVKSHQQANERFSKAYDAAKTDEERVRVSEELGRQVSSSYYAGQFLALIREHPRDPAVLDAFRWMLIYVPHDRETGQAVETLLRDWIKDERLEGVCQRLWYTPCPVGDRLLRAAIAESPHRTVQGHARFSLAVSLRTQADRLADHPPADREPYEREAEQLLQQVIDKYADLKHFTTLGQEAEADLYALPSAGPIQLVGEPVRGGMGIVYRPTDSDASAAQSSQFSTRSPGIC